MSHKDSTIEMLNKRIELLESDNLNLKESNNELLNKLNTNHFEVLQKKCIGLQDLVTLKNVEITQLREANILLHEEKEYFKDNFELAFEDIERTNTYNNELQNRLKNSNDYLNNNFSVKIRKLEEENSRLKDELNLQSEYKKYLVNHALEVIHSLQLDEMLSENINSNSTVLDIIEELILGYKELFKSNKSLNEYVDSIKECRNNKKDDFQYKYEKTKPSELNVQLEKTLGGKIDYNKQGYISGNKIYFLKV